VSAFQYREDAERFYAVLGKRLGKFGLELSEAKTRIISFSRHHEPGKTSFDFLGFEFRWGKDRSGKPHLKRRTSRKKLHNSLVRFTEWCKENRHLRLNELFRQLNAKLRGYYNYYGVHGNSKSLNQFFQSAKRILYKWLNRRSQRHSFNWESFNRALDRFNVERPRVVGRPKTRQAVETA
jgi:RNA-directed DNA polymerase